MKKQVLTLALLAIAGMGSAQASVIEIGDGANAVGEGDIAIGDGAAATGGSFSRMVWNGSGWDVSTQTAAATATGKSAVAAAGGVANGDQANAARAAVAVGYQANASQQGNVAVGDNARATGSNGAMAMGQNALATASNSVAIGRNSVADEANTVSVSGPSLPNGRRIVGVANGVNAHDAVNVQQMNAAIASGTGNSRIEVNGPATGGDADAQSAFDIAIGANSSTFSGTAGVPSPEYGSNIAIGQNAEANFGSVVVGENAIGGRNAVVMGNNAQAGGVNGWGGVAIGWGANAQSSFNSPYAVAIGNSATVVNNARVAIDGTADALGSVAISGHTRGRENVVAFGDETTGIYRQLTGVAAGTADTDAVNVRQLLDAIDGIEGGTNPYFAAQGTGVAGEDAVASAVNSTASGAAANASAYGATANGAGANASGEASTAVGHQANADGNEGTALGAYARAGNHCSAVGYGAECDEYGTTSFGRTGETSRLINVSPGINDSDAATVGQIAPLAQSLGGGSSYIGGVFMPPAYNFISGASYNNVGDALADLDQRVYDLEQQPPGSGPAGPQGADGRSAYEVAVDNGFPGSEQEWLDSLKGEQGERGETGPQGPAGEDGQDGQDGEDGADGQDGDTGPQGPAGEDGQDGAGNGSTAVAGRNIEVQDNDDGTQTVSLSDNVELSEQGSVKVGATTVNNDGVTIQGGPSMTKNGVDAGGRRITNVAPGRIASDSWDAVNGSQLWELNDRWENRMGDMDKRISGVCAMGAAQAQAIGAAAANGARRKVSAGIGYCGGQAAMSANMSWDATTPSGSIASFSIGVSSTGDDTSVGAGVSFGW